MIDGWRRVRELADGADQVIPGHDPGVLRRNAAPRENLAAIIARLG